jgi:site-specific recombinase XerD
LPRAPASGGGSRRTSCVAHALELASEGVPLNSIQRQLGHANLGTSSIYLQGIDPEEIIAAVRTRR